MADDMNDLLNKAKDLKLYYNCRLCVLGIAEESWEQIVVVRFVPFVRSQPRAKDFSLSHGDASEKLGYAELPVIMIKTLEWELVGDL